MNGDVGRRDGAVVRDTLKFHQVSQTKKLRMGQMYRMDVVNIVCHRHFQCEGIQIQSLAHNYLIYSIDQVYQVSLKPVQYVTRQFQWTTRQCHTFIQGLMSTSE